MYTVERKDNQFFVHGPKDFEQILPSDAVGVVVRLNGDDSPHQFSVQVKDMTNAEIVGLALELPAYPTS